MTNGPKPPASTTTRPSPGVQPQSSGIAAKPGVTSSSAVVGGSSLSGDAGQELGALTGGPGFPTPGVLGSKAKGPDVSLQIGRFQTALAGKLVDFFSAGEMRSATREALGNEAVSRISGSTSSTALLAGEIAGLAWRMGPDETAALLDYMQKRRSGRVDEMIPLQQAFAEIRPHLKSSHPSVTDKPADTSFAEPATPESLAIGQFKAALSRKLADLFDADEMRRSVLPVLGEKAASQVPGNPSSPSLLADKIVDLAWRMGPDETVALLSCMQEERPGRADEVIPFQEVLAEMIPHLKPSQPSVTARPANAIFAKPATSESLATSQFKAALSRKLVDFFNADEMRMAVLTVLGEKASSQVPDNMASPSLLANEIADLVWRMGPDETAALLSCMERARPLRADEVIPLQQAFARLFPHSPKQDARSKEKSVRVAPATEAAASGDSDSEVNRWETPRREVVTSIIVIVRSAALEIAVGHARGQSVVSQTSLERVLEPAIAQGAVPEIISALLNSEHVRNGEVRITSGNRLAMAASLGRSVMMHPADSVEASQLTGYFNQLCDFFADPAMAELMKASFEVELGKRQAARPTPPLPPSSSSKTAQANDPAVHEREFHHLFLERFDAAELRDFFKLDPQVSARTQGGVALPQGTVSQVGLAQHAAGLIQRRGLALQSVYRRAERFADGERDFLQEVVVPAQPATRPSPANLEHAMTRLFSDRFNDAELRAFLNLNAKGQSLTSSLPSSGVSHAQVASEATAMLGRRGLLTVDFYQRAERFANGERAFLQADAVQTQPATLSRPANLEAAVSQLFFDRFSDAEIQMFLRQNPEGEVSSSLPGSGVDHAQLVSELVFALNRRGYLSEEFYERAERFADGERNMGAASIPTVDAPPGGGDASISVCPRTSSLSCLFERL